MALLIFLALILVPVIEIGLFILIGGEIGVMPTLAGILVTAILGTAMLRVQGISTLRKAQESLARNEMPLQQVFDGLCLLFAGALLLTPGFFTDAIGFLLLVPPLRQGVAGSVVRHVKNSPRFTMHASGNGFQGFHAGSGSPGEGFPGEGFPGSAGPGRPQGGRGPTIDGEFTPLDPDEVDRESPSGSSPWSKTGKLPEE